MVFGQTYKGGRRTGRYKKWSCTACFNSTFNEAGEGGILGKYSGALVVFGGKYGGILCKVL